jgi:hypothetical protein
MMKITRNICSILCLAAAFLIACGPAIPRSSVQRDSRTGAEDRFDPLGFPGDDAVITGNYRAASTIPVSDSGSSVNQPNAVTIDSLASNNTGQPAQSLEVFRVQVFASKSFDEAEQFAANIKSLFPEGVFVEYQMPYYKVRVGEFITPEEGESFLDEVKQLGFKNAWLVRVFR